MSGLTCVQLSNLLLVNGHVEIYHGKIAWWLKCHKNVAFKFTVEEKYVEEEICLLEANMWDNNNTQCYPNINFRSPY